MKIRLRVQEVAEARGWKAARLSRRADLGTSTVYNLWDGKTQDPGLLTLLRVAAVIGVPVEELYEVLPDDGTPDVRGRALAPALAAGMR